MKEISVVYSASTCLKTIKCLDETIVYKIVRFVFD